MNKIELQDKELKAHIDSLPKDEMSVFVMSEGRIRGALFHGTRFVNQARLQHNLGILETMIFGNACLCGALMIPTMKGQEHINWRYEIDGKAKGFNVEADSKGFVRGFLLNERIPVDKPLENWNLSPFLGKGFMTFTTIRPNEKNHQESTVQIDSCNIAKDLAWYYKQSEQVSTAFNTSIQMDKQGRVIGAGGMFLQVMPETGGTKKNGSVKNSSADVKADEKLLERAELAFKTAPSLGQWFSEKGTHEDIIYGLFREFKPSIALKRDIKFDCPCNKEYFLDYIKRLPKSEVEDIKKNGPNPLEVRCNNCGSIYTIDCSEI